MKRLKNSAAALCLLVLWSPGPAPASPSGDRTHPACSSSSPAAVEQALTYLHCGNDAAAIALLTQLIRTDPANLTARRLLAQAQSHSGNSQTALLLMEQVVKLDPSSENLSVLADCSFAAGDTERARSLYTAALVRTPDHLNSILGLIAIAVSNHQMDAARSLCRQGLTRVRNEAGQNLLRSKLAEIDQFDAAHMKADS